MRVRAYRPLFMGILLVLSGVVANPQNPNVLLADVSLELGKPMQKGALFHWSITNNLNFAVYAYSFYLWGPAYSVERVSQHVCIDTTPVAEQASCPPNRFPPVLLLAIGPHRTIEGDFTDAKLKDVDNNSVSMRIAVGTDPYGVVRKAKAFEQSKCKHSPYDAIVKWGRIIESNRISLQTREKEE